MKIAKSRSYEIDGSNISFEFDREDGKIIGIKSKIVMEILFLLIQKQVSLAISVNLMKR